MKDRTIPRPIGFRILLLVGVFFVLAIVWLTLNPPADDDPDTTPPAPATQTDSPTATEVEDLGDGRFRVGTIEFDENRRTIHIPAAVQELEDPVEYVLVARHGKFHESVFITDADAHDIHVAALLLGMRPRRDLGPAHTAATLGELGVIDGWVEWKNNGTAAKLPLHESVILADPGTRQPAGTLPGGGWLYNGSGLADGQFLASRNGSIISIIRDPSALINNPGPSRTNDDLHTANAAKLPGHEHPVRIVLMVAPPRRGG